jgi:hypothetical protein
LDVKEHGVMLICVDGIEDAPGVVSPLRVAQSGAVDQTQKAA